MLRTLIKLVVLALIVHAGWRVTPVYLNYLTFRDRLEETARFAGQRSEAELLKRVMEIAGALDLPLEAHAVRIRRDRDYTFIDATYTEVLELLPTYEYAWTFVARADAWAAPAGPSAGVAGSRE